MRLMRKLHTMVLVLIIGIMSLSGCSKEIGYDVQTAALEELSKMNTQIELYIEEPFTFGKYEVENGFYTGAYVASDEQISGELSNYEQVMGQTQTFKVFQYHMEEGLSSQDILKCIAQKKVPYIKILLDENYDLTEVYRLIYDLKSTHTLPVFIELYPLTARSYTSSQYKEAYQRAYELIHKHLKDVVIVWSVDDDRVNEVPIYFPGDEFIDWAGLNIYIPRYKQNEPYKYEGYSSIDFWYKNFQHKKPMLISSLAISHFSRVDHTYTIQDAQSKLEFFYKDLIELYPRLKGIIYIDVDMATVDKNGKEDYRLTSQNSLTDKMSELFAELNCVPYISEPTRPSGNIYMKYTVTGTMFDEDLYLSEEYVKKLFGGVPLNKIAYKQDLSGINYYLLEDIQKFVTCYYKDVKK